VIVGAKWADREWLAPLSRASLATVYEPNQLPLDPETISGIAIAYTENTYEYGTEGLSLQVVADAVIGQEFPTEHGWIVQNTETFANAGRALDGEPVVRTHLHVDGYLDGRRLQNRLFEAPVGTPVSSLFTAAGIDLPPEAVPVDGGPG
jgi:Predicted NADH:ubiquinone oxidoreductase, subunit RnfC